MSKKEAFPVSMADWMCYHYLTLAVKVKNDPRVSEEYRKQIEMAQGLVFEYIGMRSGDKDTPFPKGTRKVFKAAKQGMKKAYPKRPK